MKISINRNQLKYIVISAMLIDHIAWAFVNTNSFAGQIMHLIGRLAGPTMAYFIYEGYIHTHDLNKYMIRMAVFALISWPPFSLFAKNSWPTMSFGAIYTLFLGLIAIRVWDSEKLERNRKFIIIAILLMLSYFGDWAFYDVLWPLMLFINKDDPDKQYKSNVAMAEIIGISGMFSAPQIIYGVFNLGVIAVPFILRFFYNGSSGKKNFFNKWFFYVFYPLHLMVLYLIKSYIL